MVGLKTTSVKSEEVPKETKKQARKRLLVRPTGRYAMFEAHYEGGGEVPVSLSGGYTSVDSAQRAIDLYLAQRKR
jgi:hypothetical protein